jgi:RNA polymerase sigma factor (sigma-70 family)
LVFVFQDISMAFNPFLGKDLVRAEGVPVSAVLARRLEERVELSEIALEGLPRLSEIVVARDRATRSELLQRLARGEEALVEEGRALTPMVEHLPDSDYRKRVDDLQYRQEYVTDLVSRAEQLFVYGDTLPVDVPVISRVHTAELLIAMHEYRLEFWRKVYEVPAVQRLALEQLGKVVFGDTIPSSIIHSHSLDKCEEETLRGTARDVVEGINHVMLQRTSEEAFEQQKGSISEILLRAPLDAEVLSEQALILRAHANRIADLEIALTCEHGSVASSGAATDPRFGEWDGLCQKFGGGATHARALVAGIDAAERPYVRIKQYLTTANFPYVRHSIGMVTRYGSLANDMMQEGAIGFMRALDKFDPHSGFALLTYGSYWVHQRASRGFDRQARLVHLPDRLIGPLSKLSEDISNDQYRDPVSCAEKVGVKPDDLQFLIPFTSHPASLQSVIRGTDRAFSDTVSSNGRRVEDDVAMRVSYAEYQERVAAALQVLNPRQRDVVVMRFGLDGKEPMTLEEVGRVLRVSRERVRQIQNKACARLGRGELGRQLRRLGEDMDD